MYRCCLKPVVDRIAAAGLLVFLSPLMLVTAIAVRLSLGAPVLFRQPRIGKNEREFTVYKFRTMRDAVRADGTPAPDHERLTKLGALLRKASLDELPQLWNVLRGDMSLIGPRPLLIDYLPYYRERERLRHTVRPGVTGWAQVNGRNSASWDDRLAMDVYYVEHLSLKLDALIVWRTLCKVVSRSDVEFAEQNSDLQKLSYERRERQSQLETAKILPNPAQPR